MDFKLPLAFVGILSALAISTYSISGYVTDKAYGKAVDNEYSCYYNGEEVDITNVSFRQYNYQVNDAEKKVTLTDKPTKLYMYIPFVH